MEKARFDVPVNKVISVPVHQSFYEVDRFKCLLYSKVRFIAKYYHTFIHVEGYSHLNLIFFSRREIL